MTDVIHNICLWESIYTKGTGVGMLMGFSLQCVVMGTIIEDLDSPHKQMAWIYTSGTWGKGLRTLQQ